MRRFDVVRNRDSGNARRFPLLLVVQFVQASPAKGEGMATVALPAILLMEVVGAIVATLAIYRAGESSQPIDVSAATAREHHG